MRYLVPVFVIAIIAITVLLVIRSTNRHSDTKKNLSNTLLLNAKYKDALWNIRTEVNTQLMAGYSDAQPIQNILDELDKELDR